MLDLPLAVTAPEVFEKVRVVYAGASARGLAFQFILLVASELCLLYSVFKSRGEEVQVFSHARLWFGVCCMAALSLGYYRFAIWLQPEENLLWLILYYPGVLLLMLPLVTLQQLVIGLVNSIGPEPIITDKVRPELAGNDCHYSVIRRFAPYVLLWFLLIPGLILNSPFPFVFQCILAGLWGIVILPIVFSLLAR